MCGICGVIFFEGASRRVDPAVLRRMTERLSHRGPDGQGNWISPDGRVGFGHARLSIVDLSPLGAQPMGNEDGSVQLTYNGEVYNHQELRRSLVERGHIFRSHTDTEAIVHRFEEVGEAAVHDLDGMFAFAAFDGRTGDVVLARDRLGVKPLYYTRVPGGVVFASEIKAILEFPGITREVDPEALYHYLTYLVSPAPSTLFRGINKLPAGYTLRVGRNGGVSQCQYWDALPRKIAVAGSSLDESLEDLFGAAVRKRLMSDVPVGVLFSGGVDSSLNASYFQDYTSEPVRTFNVGFDGTSLFPDESGFAAEMSALIGTEHHQVRIGEREFTDFIRDLVYYQDEPIADPVCIPLYFVSRLARQTNTPVVHVGEGADETFTGYANYLRFLRWHDNYWTTLRKMPSPLVRAAGALMSSLGPQSGTMAKAADILRRAGEGKDLFMSSAVAYYEREKAAILAPAFRERMRGVDSFDVVRPYYAHLRQEVDNPTFLELLTYVELKLRLPELLLARVDKITMANSIEARVPFLDYRLVEFALSVPSDYKVRNGVGKDPLKRMAAKRLPVDRIFKQKSGFGAPIQEWFASTLGEEFRRLLHRHRDSLSEYLNVEAIIQRTQRPLPRVNDAFQLWVLFNFVQWFEHYILEEKA